jgi:hypothetical protein
MSSLSLASTAGRLSLPRWLPLLLVVVLAIVMRHALNTDVSWGLTMADKVLDGERLYVDIIEVNPPATVFLYVLPAWLGRLSGLPAEFFVYVLIFATTGISIWLAGCILRRSGVSVGAGWMLANLAAAIVLILPGKNFGEREHIALIAILPVLATSLVRAHGKMPDGPLLIAAGICGGITAIIKPHFAIPIVLIAAVAALHARSWRPILAPENWIAACLLAVYAGVVMIAYPQFISDIIPMVTVVYVPVKASLARLLLDFATPIWFAAVGLTALLKGRALFEPRYSLPLAASIGFLIGFFVQGKGWPYQAYPMLALALGVLVLAAIEHWQRESAGFVAGPLSRLASALVVFCTVGLAMAWLNLNVDAAALAPAVRTIKPHPKIIALSDKLWLGFPLTRMVDGTWAGRAASLWITGCVWIRRHNETLDPQTAARLAAYVARDRVMFAEDVARNRPDVILVDGEQPAKWRAWANAYPPLAAQLNHYHKYRSVDGIDILRRDADR